MDTPPSNPSPELLTQLPRENVLQDDGVHMLVSTKGVEGSRSDGILLRRCAFSLAAPLCCELLGQYRLLSDGFWHASLRSPPREDGSLGPPQLGIYGTELDALVNLWANRRHLDLGSRV
ncbi:hypothetical protein [Variovorax saccharolyticus]|uniref:hypothetical protein n=1 Tax=Variovorax saccharolyticus TaxID=3053516 RepID=UPI0025767335|nr:MULTISPECIES: hypothetical protein [unclassified Variovorax]MDM0019575.1 hypothetical protein [Variovorax sp. J22R187]MDM0029417.1 hypothetical protein [Variovorax sp. J31P216]